MSENKSNTGVWVGAGFLALATAAFFYLKNKSKKDTANENKALDDLTTSDATSQAALLKKYLGVVELPGAGFVANPVTSNQWGCFNVCNEIIDYPAVQTKFSALCENRYTLQRAFETGLTDAQYKDCQTLLKAQKVNTTKATKVYLLSSKTTDTSTSYREMPANTLLGSILQSGIYSYQYGNNTEMMSSYMFFNGFDSKNNPLYAFVEKNNSELITPK